MATEKSPKKDSKSQQKPAPKSKDQGKSKK